MKHDKMTTSKPINPQRHDRRSVQEYEDEGLQQAVNFFAQQPGTYREHSAVASDVRAAIDKLPDETLLPAMMADFWLGLSKTQGQRRRRNRPPPSPFVKAGRNLQAGKEQIEDWDKLWLSQDAVRIFAKSGSSKVRSIGELIRIGLPWLIGDKNALIGCAAELPVAKLEQAMKHPEKLGVAWMSVEQALRCRWLDVEEQKIWFERFSSATLALLAELQAALLARVLEE